MHLLHTSFPSLYFSLSHLPFVSELGRTCSCFMYPCLQNDVQDSDKLVSETLRIDNNVLHERLIQIESTVSRLVESLSLQHPLSVDPSRSSADRDVFPPNSSLKTGSSPKHTDDCSLFVANESSFSYEEKYTLLSDRIESLQQKLDSLFSNAANCTRSSYEDKEEGVRIETTPSPGSQSLEFILSRLSNLEDNLSLLKKESISSHAYMPLSIPAIPRIQLKIPSTNVTREISPSSPISEYPNEVLLVQLYTSPPPEDNLSENVEFSLTRSSPPLPFFFSAGLLAYLLAKFS